MDARYVILWDDGIDSGELPGNYRTKEEATKVARKWMQDRVNAEDNTVEQKAYRWDVILRD